MAKTSLLHSVKAERERQVSYININMGYRETVLMNLIIGGKWSHRCREQTSGHCGERVGCIGSSTHICTLPRAKQITRGKLLGNTGSSAWQSVMT